MPVFIDDLIIAERRSRYREAAKLRTPQIASDLGRCPMRVWKSGDAVSLISFDIDGTLEVGDPPELSLSAPSDERVTAATSSGVARTGTVRYQEELWAQHGVTMDFVIVKQGLLTIKSTFDIEQHLHIGDTDVDALIARQAGFSFLHSVSDDVDGFRHEHGLHEA